MSTEKEMLIEVGSKGSCLLCLADCQNDGITTNTTTRAFKMLLRYLEVDTRKFGPLSTSFYSFIYGPGGGDIGVYLCHSCSSLAAQFLRLFQILEMTRMEIVTCVGKIHDKIIVEGGQETKIQESPPKSADIAQVLRKEAKEKCARLTLTKPRILLRHSSVYKSSCSFAELIVKKESCDLEEDSANLQCKQEQLSPSVSEIETQDEIYRVKPEVLDLDESFEEPPPVLIEALPFNLDSEFLGMGETDDEIPVLFRQDTLEISSTNSSRLEKGRPVKRKMKCEPPLNPRKCIHCGKCFCSVNILETHSMIHHTFAHFSPKIPPSIPESEWTQALDSILAKRIDIPTPTYGRAVHKCHLCNTSTFHNGFRKHVLVNHFNAILAACESCPSSLLDSTISVPRPEECSDDDEESDLRSVINRHRVKLPGGKCKCLICGEILDVMNNYGRHYREIHGKKKFSCVHCNLRFCRPERLGEHLSRTHPSLHFAAKLPPDTTESEVGKAIESLRKVEITPAGKDGLTKCLVCPKKYRQMYKVKLHILDEHLEEIASAVEKLRAENPLPSTSTGEKRTKLEKVPSTVELENQNTRVADNTHSTLPKAKTYITPITRKSSATILGVLRAPSPAESDEEEGGPEVDLSRRSVVKYRLKLPDGKYKCLICDQILKRRYGFRRHYIELHAGIRVKCIHCDMRFSRQGGLKRHLSRVHPALVFADKLPPNTSNDEVGRAIEFLRKKGKAKCSSAEEISLSRECPFCGRKFREPFKLKIHILDKHTKEVASAVVKVREEDQLRFKYKCPECEATFADIDSQRRHRLEAHTGFMHKCSYCEEQFRRRDRVTAHERTEHTSQVFRERFPPGTTDEEVTQVLVEDLCVYFVKKNVADDANGKSYEINRRQWMCQLCNKVFTFWKPPEKREHLVRCHMDQIVANLKRKK